MSGDSVMRAGLDETGVGRTGQAVPRRPPTRDASAAIEVSHLTKVFGGRAAVSDVSLSVAVGEVFGFLGPNGAGKTTTVRILGTLISPTAGSATVAGIPVGPGGAAEIRQRIAVMPESPGLYQRLTVTENLEYFARLYGLPRRQQRITEALAAVGLADRAHDLTGQLSKGLRQRAALARSLLNEPEVMFLDEPTSGLDPVATHEVHGLIAGLRDRGVTVFLTTHRLEEAERLCDRVAIMSTSLRTIGRPDDLRRELFTRSLNVTVAAPASCAMCVGETAHQRPQIRRCENVRQAAPKLFERVARLRRSSERVLRHFRRPRVDVRQRELVEVDVRQGPLGLHVGCVSVR